MFVKASKKRARLRLALIGPAGSGKTMTSLRIARGLAGPTGRIALLDSEAGSASKYADKVEFDVVEPDSFAPERYIEVIEAAAKAKYDVLVIDSLSHAWMGKDGILADVDKAAKRSSSGNSFGAWRDATPRQVALVDAIIRAPFHIVCTIRSKVEHVAEKDERGKTVIRKIGLQPVQREGLEYEFDVVGDIDDQHVLRITKSRFSDIADSDIVKPSESFGEKLAAWLDDGVAPPPPPPKPKTTDEGWKSLHLAIQDLDDAETHDDVRKIRKLFKDYVEGQGKTEVAEDELEAMRAYFKAATDRVRGTSSTYTDDELALIEMLTAAHQRSMLEAERNVDPPPPPETSTAREADEVIP